MSDPQVWVTVGPGVTVTIPAPTPEPVHDPILAEWHYTDQDGITYYGATPGECYRQAAEGVRVEAAHWKQWQNRPEHYRDDEGERTPCQAIN